MKAKAFGSKALIAVVRMQHEALWCAPKKGGCSLDCQVALALSFQKAAHPSQLASTKELPEVSRQAFWIDENALEVLVLRTDLVPLGETLAAKVVIWMIEALEARAHKRCSLTAITSDVVMLQEPQQEWAESFQGRQQLVLLLEESSQKLLLLLNLQRVQAPHQRLQEEAGSGPRAVWALQQELKLGLGLGKAVSTKQRCQLFHGLLQSPLDGGVSQSSCEAMPQVLRVACYHVKQLRQLPGNHAGEDFRGQDRLEPSLRAFLSSLLLVRGLVEGRTVLSRLGAGIAAEDVVPAGLSRIVALTVLTLDPMPQERNPHP